MPLIFLNLLIPDHLPPASTSDHILCKCSSRCLGWCGSQCVLEKFRRLAARNTNRKPQRRILIPDTALLRLKRAHHAQTTRAARSPGADIVLRAQRARGHSRHRGRRSHKR
eukprot:2962908-Prymnesium_polylepis.3